MKEPSKQKTMLKTVDWGGLTIMNLLAVFAFPPYFISLMAVAALTASGFLWTMHLSEVEHQKFIDFEKEFRKGYKLEKAGQIQEALKWYRKLEKQYAGFPQAGKLAALQIENLTKGKKTAKARGAKPRKKA